ncbi:MAG: DUF4097 family beta strand repeat-containing protein [Candidatus Riflebacteria bacterium]
MNFISRLILNFLKFFVLYLPCLILAMALATNGIYKIMLIAGVADWRGNEPFVLMFQGIPGLIYAASTLISGVGFLILTSRKVLIDFLNSSIAEGTWLRRIRLFSWGSLFLLFVLFFISLTKNNNPLTDLQELTFSPSQIRKIVLDFPDDQIHYNQAKIKIHGKPDAEEVKVLVKRQIGIWGQVDKALTLQNYNYKCEHTSSSDLVLGGFISTPDWYFFPYPELEFEIIVPEKQMIDLSVLEVWSDQKVKTELHNLQGPIKAELSYSNVLIKNLNSPEIAIKTIKGNVTLESFSAKSLQITSERGFIKASDFSAVSADFSNIDGTTQVTLMTTETATFSNFRNYIVIENSAINNVKTINRSGETLIECRSVTSATNIKAESETGQILVYLPSDVSPVLEINSNYSITENQFDSQFKSPITPYLQLKTIKGSLRIQKWHKKNQPRLNPSLPAEALPDNQ